MPDEARIRTDELFRSLALRFGPLLRGPAYEQLRPKLARAALVPSRVFKDSSAWTGIVGPERTVEFFASRIGDGRYHMEVRAEPPAPAQPGDYRARLHLRSLQRGEYEWRMGEELALGTTRPTDLARALTTVFASAAKMSGGEGRARLGRELPRTSAVLGRLFSLDELGVVPAADGSATIALKATMHPDGIQAELPRYSRYLMKYVTPLRFEAVAFDEVGAGWWQVQARERSMSLRLRVHNGSLAPLQGPPRGIPDQLGVRANVSTKMGIFRVGLKRLQADVRLIRGPHEKSFAARFRRAPDWELPFLIEPLLRSSLRRPFQGEGASLSLALRAGEEGQTLLSYRYEIAVKESWIVRWLGDLMGSALSEFRLGAEEEADRFNAQVLAALREDVLELIS